jgi:hypothetical protein
VFSILIVDTNLAEDIMTYTSRQAFNRVLEVQQSRNPWERQGNLLVDLVAGFDASSQTAAIEVLIAKDVPALDILRLLCLQSLVGGGLKPKELDGLRKQFLQVGVINYSH